MTIRRSTKRARTKRPYALDSRAVTPTTSPNTNPYSSPTKPLFASGWWSGVKIDPTATELARPNSRPTGRAVPTARAARGIMSGKSPPREISGVEASQVACEERQPHPCLSRRVRHPAERRYGCGIGRCLLIGRRDKRVEQVAFELTLIGGLFMRNQFSGSRAGRAVDSAGERNHQRTVQHPCQRGVRVVAQSGQEWLPAIVACWPCSGEESADGGDAKWLYLKHGGAT